MSFPIRLRRQYIERFDSLIADGDNIVLSLRMRNTPTGPVIEWGTKCGSLLMQVLPLNHPRRADIPQFGSDHGCLSYPPTLLAQLKGLRDDFQHGFLDNVAERVAAEFAADYMGQAKGLLTDGGNGSYNHLLAAFLCGAVLEKSLRDLCAREVPPLPTTKADGKPFTMQPIIQTLKKADVILATEAAQLIAWAAIRNKAAHGEFNGFTRQEVAAMIDGVQDFLSRHAS